MNRLTRVKMTSLLDIIFETEDLLIRKHLYIFKEAFKLTPVTVH